VRRRRILGVSVVGSLDEADRAIASTRADEVLVSIPAAPQERLGRGHERRRPGRRAVPRRSAARRARRAPRSRDGRGRADVSTTSKAGGEPRPDFLARFLGARTAPRRLLRARRAVRVAGLATPGPDDLHRRARAHPARAARSPKRGSPHAEGCPYDSLATLVAYVLAPVWWLGSAAQSWAAAKLVPRPRDDRDDLSGVRGRAAWWVPKWYALAAATAAVAVPALAYAPILVEEPLAYPVATLALWAHRAPRSSDSRGDGSWRGRGLRGRRA
jgi:hypothetical protein